MGSSEAGAGGETVRGTVYLVGAGPGDPGLLTIAAARVLRRADVVVHDALVGREILDLIPAAAARIDAGKRCGGRKTSQDEINRILIESSRQHRIVVRLKGGDPFVFGRGGEEALALRQAGIRFRVVPGVTAGIGVSAFAGIPVTHRDLASSVTFVTGHEEVGRLAGRVDWDALARVEGTLVVYMGVGSMASMTTRLIAAGRLGETPAAVIEWGTLARQRVVTAPLSEIAAAARRAGFGTPALVVIGEVVELREHLAWFDRLPLRGRRIVVARSRPQPSRIARSLRRLGGEVREYPELESAAVASDPVLDRALGRLGEYGWVLFTSPAGVRYFWEMLESRGLDTRSLGTARVAGFGAATATALRRKGVVPDLSTRTFDVEEVLNRLEQIQPVSGSAILFPHGDRPSAIAATLREHGAAVDEVKVFETRKVWTDKEEIFRDAEVVVLPSSTATMDVAEALRSAGFAGRIVAIGPSTAQTALAQGLTVDAIAPDHTVNGIVRTVLGFFGRDHRGGADLLELASSLPT